jgi:hypothetical protein
MDPIARRLDVHTCEPSQLEADLTAALEGALGEQAPQLRQQRRKRRLGSRGQPTRPEHLGELVAVDHSIAIDDEIREEEPSLPAGQVAVDASTSHPGREAPAELNPRALWLSLHSGHRPKLSPKA